MPSKIIHLNRLEDLAKLKGWTIQDIVPIPGGRLRITVSHPAADNAVAVTIAPLATLGTNGNLVTLSRDLSVSVDDIT